MHDQLSILKCSGISPGQSSWGEDSTGEGVWIAPLLAGGVFEAKDLIMMEFSRFISY